MKKTQPITEIISSMAMPMKIQKSREWITNNPVSLIQIATLGHFTNLLIEGKNSKKYNEQIIYMNELLLLLLIDTLFISKRFF